MQISLFMDFSFIGLVHFASPRMLVDRCNTFAFSVSISCATLTRLYMAVAPECSVSVLKSPGRLAMQLIDSEMVILFYVTCEDLGFQDHKKYSTQLLDCNPSFLPVESLDFV